MENLKVLNNNTQVNLELNEEPELRIPKPHLVETKLNENYTYVGIVFEDRFNRGKFKGNCYNYKTKKDLKEGQVLLVPTKFGETKGCVTHINVDPNSIQYPLEDLLEV